MTRYQKLAEKLSANSGEAILPIYSPYVMLGYPTAETSFEVCKTLIAEGVPSLELGLPFRDPAADGPVIQAAGITALENGFTTAAAVELVTRLRALNGDVALTLMCYYNMVLAKGVENFVSAFAKAGIDAILIPDLPPERANEVLPVMKAQGVDLILIASPLSDNNRLSLINEIGSGFVYVVTRLGITGVSAQYDDVLDDLFARIKQHISRPAFAGFGISEPDQAVQMVKSGAQGVITGSRLVQLVDECVSQGAWNSAPLIKHTRAMLEALRGC